MSKRIITSSIILIIFSLFISCYTVYASNIDMNLQPEQNQNETTQDVNTIQSVEQTTSETQVPADSEYTQPTSVGSITEEGLGLTNILNILLITIGVVLILLSIAIIIRLK